MTEREYIQEQARLRAIAYNTSLPVKERDAAQAGLDALVKRYESEYPTIKGVFRYTQEDVEEARRHGF